MTVKTTEQQIPETKKVEQPKVEKEIQQPNPAAVTGQSEESKDDRNWKKFREEREKERKMLEETRKKAEESERQAAALKAALEAVTNRPSPVAQQEYSYQQEDTEEQRIQKAVSKAIADSERRREDQHRAKEAEELPNKLAQTYPNFNEVCSDDNLDYMQYHYPEIYNSWKSTPDSFDKWGNVYKAVKRFIPNVDNSRRDEKKIEQNMKKPQSMSVPGVTPTGDSAPYKIDDKRRSDNWQRMQRTIKGLNH